MAGEWEDVIGEMGGQAEHWNNLDSSIDATTNHLAQAEARVEQQYGPVYGTMQ